MSNQIIPNENESLKEQRSCFSFMDQGSSFNVEEDKYSHGRWTYEEHQSFIEGVLEFGTNWSKLAQIIGTRSILQIKSHAQKYTRQLINESENNQPNDVRIDNSFTQEDMSKLNKKDIESILLLKLRFNYFNSIDEIVSDKQKYFSIIKTKKKPNQPMKGIVDKLLEILPKEDVKLVEESIIKNNNNDNEDQELQNKKGCDNIFDFSTENNFCKMEELKKMSEVLHILNRSTPESTSSQTSNKSNQIQYKILRSNAKNRRNSTIEIKNLNSQLNIKNDDSSKKKATPMKSKKERDLLKCTRKAKAFTEKNDPQTILISNGNSKATKANNSHQSKNASIISNSLPTEQIFELFKTLNQQLNNNNLQINPNNAQLRLNMNLNSIINNNNFTTDSVSQAHIQQKLYALNLYQQLQQIQQLQLNQFNPYSIENNHSINNLNYTNHNQFPSNYSNGYYANLQLLNQGLYYRNQRSLLNLNSQNLFNYSFPQQFNNSG